MTSPMAMVARPPKDASIPRGLGRAGRSAGCSMTRGGREWRSYDQMVNSSPAASSPAAAAGGTRSHGEQRRKEEGKVVPRDLQLTVKAMERSERPRTSWMRRIGAMSVRRT